MLVAIAIVSFLIVGAAVFVYGMLVYVRPTRALENLASPLPGLHLPDIEQRRDAPPSFRIRTAMQWLGQRVPLDPSQASDTNRILMAAGFRSEAALSIFYAWRILSVLVFFLITSAVCVFVPLDFFYRALIVLLFSVLGFWVPVFVLESKVQSRHDVLRLALPDVLDMLVICVEAGMALDQSIRLVSEELAITHPELCRDLSMVVVEMRTGVKRSQALRNFADRTMEPEIAKLVAVLIQTDRFGTSVADALRSHADFMRLSRRHQAEEAANKLSVKIVFPVFFLIMPAIIVVSAGPTIIRIAKQLIPALQGH